MGSTIYKTYDLEEVLNLYICKNNISVLLDEQSKSLHEGSNVKATQSSFDEEIDLQLERDFFEDVGIIENETQEEQICRVKRYQKIVKILKKRYQFKCQLCGYTFHMDNGNYYCEAHHIKMLSKDGSQRPENTIILCANHHRMFHYASNTCDIGELIDNRRVIKVAEDKFTVQY